MNGRHEKLNGLEQDVIYHRNFYAYLVNNSKLVHWTKRHLNKKRRLHENEECHEIEKITNSNEGQEVDLYY